MHTQLESTFAVCSLQAQRCLFFDIEDWGLPSHSALNLSDLTTELIIKRLIMERKGSTETFWFILIHEEISLWNQYRLIDWLWELKGCSTKGYSAASAVVSPFKIDFHAFKVLGFVYLQWKYFVAWNQMGRCWMYSKFKFPMTKPYNQIVHFTAFIIGYHSRLLLSIRSIFDMLTSSAFNFN